MSATFSDSSWMTRWLQANDTFYPTGSYAHSFGLEGLIQNGWVRDRATLREFVFVSLIPSLRANELAIAAHAWGALIDRSWEDVGQLCVLSSALKAPRELREASEKIGRQRIELCAQLHASALARELLDHAAEKRWPLSTPIAAAVEGQTHGAPLEAVLASLYYSALAAVIAAAMKLLRLGQNGAQTLLTEALAAAPESIDAAKKIPRDEIGWFNPWLDIPAARHELAMERLFIS